jgi:hypothetical protein
MVVKKQDDIAQFGPDLFLLKRFNSKVKLSTSTAASEDARE